MDNKKEYAKKFFDAIMPEDEYIKEVERRKQKEKTTTYFFHQRLILLDSFNRDLSDQCKPYHVKFYDDEVLMIVRATNFSTAGILAMASRIHSKESFGIEYVENMKGVRVPIDIKD